MKMRPLSAAGLRRREGATLTGSWGRKRPGRLCYGDGDGSVLASALPP